MLAILVVAYYTNSK